MSGSTSISTNPGHPAGGGQPVGPFPIRVLLVDDHALMRDGTRRLFDDQPDIEVVGEAQTADEARRLVVEVRPSVVVLDLRLASENGIDVARWLRQYHPEVRILILTGYDHDQYVRAAIRIGVPGFALKSDTADTLIQGLRTVAAGGTVYPEQFAQRAAVRPAEPRPGNAARLHQLTQRELEVARLLADGERNGEIARILHVNVKTVEKHITNIIEKLGARNRTEAALLASRQILSVDTGGAPT